MVVGVHGEIEWRAANRKKGEQNTEPGVEQVTADDLLWIHKVIEQKEEKIARVTITILVTTAECTTALIDASEIELSYTTHGWHSLRAWFAGALAVP